MTKIKRTDNRQLWEVIRDELRNTTSKKALYSNLFAKRLANKIFKWTNKNN